MCGTPQSFSFRSLFLANNYIILVSRSYLEEDMLTFLNTLAILKRSPNMHVINQAYNHNENEVQ